MRLMIFALAVLALTACGGAVGNGQSTSSAAPAQVQATAATSATEPIMAAWPQVADGQYEAHGTFNGERIWLRLGPREERFAGGRVLRLLYTPLTDDDVLLDLHPMLLLDDQLRIRAWSERTRLTAAMYGEGGYQITHEGEYQLGGERFLKKADHQVASSLVWDADLAPVLLALAWQPESTGTVHTRKLMHPSVVDEEPGVLHWEGSQAQHDGVTWQIAASPAGRVQAITSADGRDIIRLDAWQPTLAPAVALERQQRFEVELFNRSDSGREDVQEDGR
ncbi:MAG: hypothetical protein ACYTF0_09605 [Planctomycetota bacterium]|jgi:hypothetical protein